MSTKNKLIFGISVLLFLVLTVIHPLGMTARQGTTLGILLAVILWWATGAVEQTAASVILLAWFLLMSGTPAQTVLSFPLSENFLLIAVSFLFSQGISNSGLTQRLLEPLLERIATTVTRLVGAMVLCSAVTALFIPQSISRTILVASLFSGFLGRTTTPKRTSCALMFGLFFTGILVGLLFIRGDIILNYSLLSMSGLHMSELQWICTIAPPTLCVLLCASGLFFLCFRQELAAYCPPAQPGARQRVPLSRRDWYVLSVIGGTVILWATEPLHGLNSTAVVTAGTVLMFPLGVLDCRDFRVVDMRLLVFLTAAFSIGGVLRSNGLADILFRALTEFLPSTFSWKYALVVMLCAMGMHLVLGSNVATLAVAVPALMIASSNAAPPLVIVLLVYVAVSQHFLLPFHHVTLAVGVGKQYFTGEQVLRFGLPLTPLVLGCGLIFYLGWWRIIGLLPM